MSVTFSPQHFKALCRSLNETLTAYESVFGKLSIPDEDTRPSRDAAQIEETVRSRRKEFHEARAITISSTEKKPPAKRSRDAAPKKAH
jgi:hypothetical protein